MGWASGRLAPPPSVVFATFVDLARTGDLHRNTLVTLGRVAAGFGIGVTVATIVGAAALVRRLLDPSLQGLRAIPSIAWVPLFILWLGIFEASKVTLIAVGVFFPVYLGLMGAIQSVDRKLVEVGRAFRCGEFCCRRCCRPMSFRCVPASVSAGCSLLPPS
jgi:sulfonate transport system permease protein